MNQISVLFFLLFLVTQIINGQCDRSQADWETFFKSRITDLDPIEGIWSKSQTLNVYDGFNRLKGSYYASQLKIYVIFKKGSFYETCTLNSIETEKVFFENSATTGIYLSQIIYKESHSNVKLEASLNGNGLLEFTERMPISEIKRLMGNNYIQGLQLVYENSWIKISPKGSDAVPNKLASGTGFAISSDGYIVTNHHVVVDSKDIKVRGLNGNFSTTYNAEIVVDDKINDLAIIKINDPGFTSLGIPTYSLSNTTADVGHSVFVLGYPLRATMGDEVKLTNGIVSSKTGFQGDITSYQISAPVQAGNSGGPVFNQDGKVVGIINSKHLGAENASYAVKINYLTNLIELLDVKPKALTVGALNGKDLSEQVKSIKNFVYILEVK